MDLVWTKSKPTVTGWYWYRLEVSVAFPSIYLVIVEANEVRRFQKEEPYNLSSFTSGEWAGPLKPPEK